MTDSMPDPMLDPMLDWEQFELEVIQLDDQLLDRLAEGGTAESAGATDPSVEPMVSFLVAWRDEARRPASQLPMKTARQASRRAAVFAAALATSISLTGVAAAVGGLDPLEPLRVVVGQVADGSSEPPTAEESPRDRITRIIERAEQALLEGDLRASQQLAQQARELAEESGMTEDVPAEARLVALEERLSDDPPDTGEWDNSATPGAADDPGTDQSTGDGPTKSQRWSHPTANPQAPSVPPGQIDSERPGTPWPGDDGGSQQATETLEPALGGDKLAAEADQPTETTSSDETQLMPSDTVDDTGETVDDPDSGTATPAP